MNHDEALRKEDEEYIKEQVKKIRPVPVFEFLLCITFMSFCVFLVAYNDLFTGQAYPIFRGGEQLWAFLFFGIGSINGFALIKNVLFLRRLGLIIAGLAFTVFFINFASGFPNFATLIYMSLAITCLVALFEVHRTSL